MTGAPLPRNIRLKAFVACEFLIRQYCRLSEAGHGDVERYVIYMAVVSATVGRVFRDPKLRALYGDEVPAPPELRGTISRRAIAESVGLPRETVRRKLQDLIDQGLIIETGRGVMPNGPALEHNDNLDLMLELLADIRRVAADIERLD